MLAARPLKKLLPYQRRDFAGIFKALEGRPATIRLLDPPLHEFLPHDESAQRGLAKKLGVSLASIKEARRRSSRIQSYARPPWLSSRHFISGGYGNAGSGHFRGCRSSAIQWN